MEARVGCTWVDHKLKKGGTGANKAGTLEKALEGAEQGGAMEGVPKILCGCGHGGSSSSFEDCLTLIIVHGSHERSTRYNHALVK